MQLNRPKYITRMGDDLLIADQQSSTLKLLNGRTGDMENYCGQVPGFEDGTIFRARFDRPAGLAVSQVDDVCFVAD